MIWKKLQKSLRGRAKSVLIRISKFINNERQIFDKHDLMNKIQEIETICKDFD